jgi:DNA-binding CsgD family transcriptional regulator
MFEKHSLEDRTNVVQGILATCVLNLAAQSLSTPDDLFWYLGELVKQQHGAGILRVKTSDEGEVVFRPYSAESDVGPLRTVKILDSDVPETRERSQPFYHALSELSDSERELIRYVNSGMSREEIAKLLSVSEPDIARQLDSIERKLAAGHVQ